MPDETNQIRPGYLSVGGEGECRVHVHLDSDSRRRKAEKVIALLSQHVELTDARVLEIGCGSGYLAASLGERVGVNGSVSAVDLHDLRQVEGSYHFTLVKDTRLPFPDESFDLVVSNHVIEHVGRRAEQLAHLREVERVLRPAGACYLALPNSRFPLEPHFRLPFLNWLPPSLQDAYVRMTGKGDRYDCDIPSPVIVRRLCRQLGLSVHELTFEAIEHFRRTEEPRFLLRAVLALPSPLLRPAMAIAPSKMYLAIKGSLLQDRGQARAATPD